MTYMLVNNNDFSGSIPISLEGLTNLEVVDFSNNELHGYLVNVKNWVRLESFKVDGNILSGEVPEGFGNITTLGKICLLMYLVSSPAANP